jgi:hypothetical protein
MSGVIDYTDTMAIIECASCGVTFGITTDYQKRRRDDHANFYCPSGHVNVYRGKTEAEKLQEMLKRAEESSRRNFERAEAEKRRHASTKGQLTKARKKLAPVETDEVQA